MSADSRVRSPSGLVHDERILKDKDNTQRIHPILEERHAKRLVKEGLESQNRNSLPLLHVNCVCVSVVMTSGHFVSFLSAVRSY